MNQKTLSKRLKLIASYLPDQANFADIGSDHAYLPCYICLYDRHARAIAGELNKGPFLRATQHVADCKLSNQIEVIQGNGLHVLHDHQVDQVVIAGMGGTLIRSILEEGIAYLTDVKRIIVQPNVEAPTVRKWFHENNYVLVAEEIIKEDGHIYEILVADKGRDTNEYDETNTNNTEIDLLFGPYLLKEKNQAFKEKWISEKAKKERIVNQMKQAKVINHSKIADYQWEITLIKEVLASD